MKVLVTGGAGFIGSHLVEELVRRGHRVRVLDNLSFGKREFLRRVRKKIEFLHGDIRSAAMLRRALRGVSCVFHQAALRSVPRSVERPLEYEDVNVRGTLLLLKACVEQKVPRLIFASSSSVYGDGRIFPQREDQPPSPVSPYAATKAAGEHLCRVFSHNFGLKTVSLRYFNVYGPRQDPHSQYAAAVARFVLRGLKGKPLEIHGDGRQSRDFTYVSDVVEANLRAAYFQPARGEVFNVFGGKAVSVLDLARAVERALGRRLKRVHTPPRPGDVRKTWADPGFSRRKLGYRPRVRLEDGIRRTLEYFRDRTDR